jgi:hypothetical protein
MTTLTKTILGALALSAALLAGCKTAPIYEVTAAPIPAPAGRTLSMADVEKAVVRGGMRAGWQVSPEAPGRATARYTQGAHTTTVGIDYDTRAYSIKMRETSVRNDGATVHRAYNTWVQGLERSINTEFLTMGQ